jgi:glycosyltransferase involved in cell wall biosynthesis
VTQPDAAAAERQDGGPAVVWLAHSLGYGGDLMYLGPILKGYVEAFPATRIFCRRELLAGNRLGLPLDAVLRTATLTLTAPPAAGGYGRRLEVPSPGFLLRLLRLRPNLVVLYDFSRVTWLGALAARLVPGCRVLLLVEGDPAYRGARHGPVQRAIRRWIARRADQVQTSNAAGGRYLREQLGVAPDRLRIAPYLTSQPVIPPDRPAADPEGRVRVLFLNSITRRKGLDRLIAAVARLDPPVRQRMLLRVVGDGPDRPACARLAGALGIAGTVCFEGALPWARVGEAYAAADVFVSPTLADYRSLAGFEALAAGLPVIASCHDGAAAEVVEDGVNGFLVDPRDPEALAQALARLIADAPLRTRLAAASRARAARFTVAGCVAALVDASRAALAARR